jgi:hypothetical protein
MKSIRIRFDTLWNEVMTSLISRDYSLERTSNVNLGEETSRSVFHTLDHQFCYKITRSYRSQR